MALDFPSTPTLNQTFTAPNGTIWQWDGVKWTAVTSVVPLSGAGGGGNVGRNLIHNPLFIVAQRGVGPWTSAGYTLDRWSLSAVNDTPSVSSATLGTADRGQIGDESAIVALQNTFAGNAAATSVTVLTQKSEYVWRISGKTITISFWAVAAANMSLGVSLDQFFGTGGSPSPQVNGNGQAVAVTTTWTRYTITIAVPGILGKTLGSNNDSSSALNFWYSTGSNFAARSGIGVQSGTIRIWGVQLEIGSVATPLEKPDPRYDRSNCERFFCVVGGYSVAQPAGAGWTLGGAVYFPTTMRAVPTAVTFASTGNLNVGAVSTFVMSASSCGYYAASLAGGQAQVQGIFTASADL